MNSGAITPEERRRLLRQRMLAEAGVESTARRDTSIVRRPDGDAPVLTDAQKRLWFLHQLEPDPSVLNVRVAVRLHGPLDPDLFPTCLARIVADHDVLQYAIVDHDGTPDLERLDDPTIEFRYDEHDLASEEERMALAERIVREDRSRVFDLAGEVPVAVRIVRLGPDDHLLSIGMHHAVSDDWSRWVFVRHLIAHYCHLVDPDSAAPESSALRYRDYAAWLADRLDDDLDGQLDHWRQQLGDHPTPTEIPPDRPRPARHTVDGDSISRTIPAELVDRLRQLSTANQATMFMTLLGGLSVVLARSTHSRDVVLGTPVAGRSAPETHDMLGVFLNTLVLRLDTGNNPTFAELIGRARDTSLDGFANQEVPFERLLEDLNPPRDPSRTPFFSTFFNMTSREYPDTLGPFRLSPVDLQEEGAKFDLTLYAHDTGSDLRLTAVYNTRLYDVETIDRIVDQFLSVLEQAVDAPDTPIMSLDLDRADTVPERPDPQADLPDGWAGTVFDKVAKHTAIDPERVAVAGPDAVWTRADLHQGALAVAGALHTAGLQHGDPVAIVSARAAQLPAAVLGCLTANTPYLILDPAYPAARLAQYLETVVPRAVLWVAGRDEIDEAIVDVVDGQDVAIDVELPADPAQFLALFPADGFSVPTVGRDDPACFHFTSGSTGVPKAVVGAQGPLTFFQDWMADEFGLDQDDRFSLLSGLAHDPLQRDLLTSMWVGATIVVPDPDRLGDPGWLARWLRDERITVAHLTPAMGQLATDTAGDATVPDLTHVFFTGAALRWELVTALDRLAPSAQMVNLYGSTESQRASGWHRVDPDGAPPADGTIAIGRPMPGAQLIVRNEGDQVCGPGEIGQLHVRSPHLSLGYHRGPGQVDTTGFRPAPGRSGGREQEYATGDLARVRPDGVIEHRGRIDQQVKVRGFRVEPADVAQGLNTHPEVTRVEVVVWGGNEPAIGAYVVVASGSSIDSADVLRHARQVLPAPLVPTRLKIVDSIPLTPNGKVDPTPLTAEVAADERTAPADDLERMLLEHWRAVLRRNDVGVNDNFFDLGGYSLLATRLFALIESSTGRRLPVATLFEGPTVARLADVLRSDQGTSSWTSLVPIQRAGRGQPLYYVTPYSISVLQLAQLGETLGGDQPLFGLQPQGLDGEAPIHATIEDMATHYISEIRSHQPEGPYAIGGHCSGSWVAFEMTRQLEAAGERVDSLILIDQGPPGVARPKTAVWRYVVHRLRFFNADGRLLDALVWQLRNALGRLLLRRVGSAQRRAAEHVNVAHRQAHNSYQGGKIDAEILFLRSEEAIRLGDRHWHLEWQRFTSGGFVTDTVPSTHAMLLEQPYVTTLADRIRRWLQRSATDGYQVES